MEGTITEGEDAEMDNNNATGSSKTVGQDIDGSNFQDGKLFIAGSSAAAFGHCEEKQITNLDSPATQYNEDTGDEVSGSKQGSLREESTETLPTLVGHSDMTGSIPDEQTQATNEDNSSAQSHRNEKTQKRTLDQPVSRDRDSSGMSKKQKKQDSRQFTFTSGTRKPYQADRSRHGLGNIGNTCYMNSAIQFLFTMDPFKERYFIGGKDDSSAFNMAMSRLAKGLFAEKTGFGVFRPSQFRSVFAKAVPAFGSYEQQDSMECFLHIIRLTEKEHSESSNSNPCNSMRIDLHEIIEDNGVVTPNQRTEYILPLPIPDDKQLRELREGTYYCPPPVLGLCPVDQHDVETSAVAVVTKSANVHSADDVPAKVTIIEKDEEQERAKQPELSMHSSLSEIEDRREDANMGETESVKTKKKRKWPARLWHQVRSCLSRRNRKYSPSRNALTTVGIRQKREVISQQEDEKVFKSLSPHLVSHASGQATVEECIEILMRRQVIHGLPNLYKETKFERFPDYIVIGARKFVLDAFGRPKQADVEIQMSESLDLSPWKLEYKGTPDRLSAHPDDDNSKYKIRALVQHSGSSHTSGHYTCFVKSRDSDDWMCCNDSSVSTVSKPRLIGGYLYLYEKIDKEQICY